MNVGDRIKRLRDRKGLTQQELADKTGYKSKVAISKIESGQRDIPRHKLERVAEVLGTTVEYLETGKNINELGDFGLNRKYLEYADPDLIHYLDELSNPNSKKRILFDKVKDLEPSDVESLLRVIRMFEEGK